MELNREEIIIDLLTDFDEMGFAPTTLVPNPEAYAVEWRRKITDAFEELTEDLHATRTELTRVQADTINKFADRLKKYYRALNDYTLSSMVAYHIDQIAKEMLEG